MNKKHLIPIAVSAFCVLAAATVLVGKNDFHFVNAITKEYHLTFDHDDVVSHSYKGDWEHDEDGCTYFTLGNATAIDNTYEFYTDDDFTYLNTYYDDIVDFDNDDDIFEISSLDTTYAYDFSIIFSLVEKATIDLTNTNILYYSSAFGYNQKMYFEYFSNENGRNYYSLDVDFNFASHYGKSFKLLQLEIFFTC